VALTDNIVAYWAMDDASGNATDSVGSNTLTENGTGGIASTTGKISNCRDFEAGDSDYFSIADNADLSTGDIDFSGYCWLNFESQATFGKWTGATIFGKWDSAVTSSWEYVLYYNASNNRMEFYKSSDGSPPNIVGVTASTYGAVPIGTWIFVACGHNATSNDIWISVNGGTPNTLSTSTGVYNGTCAFRVGWVDSGTSEKYDGLIDEVAFFKRDIRSDLSSFYNGGSGLAYPFSGGGGAVIPVFMNQYRQRVA